jgi:cell division protein FtsQ
MTGDHQLIPAGDRFRRHQTRRRVGVAVGVATLLTLVGLGWALVRSSAFGLDNVVVHLTVNPTSNLTSQVVTAAAAPPLHRPLVELPVTAIRDRVADLPDVAAVAVHRAWPHTLVIDVTARRAAARLAAANGQLLADRAGVVYGPVGVAAPAAAAGLPIVRLPGVTLHVSARPQPLPAAAVRALRSLPRRVRQAASGLRYGKEGLAFRYRRVAVRWGTGRSGRLKAAELGAVMDRAPGRRPGWLDLSTPGVVVTRGTRPSSAPGGGPASAVGTSKSAPPPPDRRQKGQRP